MKHLIFLLLSVSRPHAETLDVTFENLPQLLQARSAKLQAVELEKQAAEERKGSFGRSFLPSLELHAAQESFKTGSEPQKSQPGFGAEAKVNLFNGGRDRLEGQIRDLDAEKKSYQAQRVKAEELQRARSLFWEILYSQEHRTLLESMLQINEQNRQAAERRIRSGVATEADRMEFAMQAVDLKRKLAETKLKNEMQTRELALLLGANSGIELKLPIQLNHSHDFEAQLAHKDEDHDFLFREIALESSKQELSAQSQKQVWWPKIDAFAAYNEYNQRIEAAGPDAAKDMRKESVLGVRMTFSLENGFEAQSQAAALKKEAAAALINAQLKKAEIAIHMTNEMAELRLLHEQVHEADENILRAEKYYKLTQSEYARGVKNSPDVLGASEKFFEAKLTRAQIIKDFQLAKAHVLAKMGK